MRNTALTLLLATAASHATAAPACQDLTIGIDLATHHFDRTEKRREVNPGIYGNCDGITAGVYLNSASKPTWWAGYTYQVGPVAITAGAGTGYRYEGGSGALAPMLILSVRLPGGLRLGVFPKSGEKSGGIHISKEF